MVKLLVRPLIPVVDFAANHTVSRYDRLELLSECLIFDEVGVSKVS